MTEYIHGVMGLVLLLFHGIFFFRALAAQSPEWKPGNLDKAARTVSHWGLPLALASGVLAASLSSDDTGSNGIIGVLHWVIGILPLILVVILSPMRNWRRRHPRFLPAANLLLFSLAAGLGIYLILG